MFVFKSTEGNLIFIIFLQNDGTYLYLGNTQLTYSI